MQQDSVASEWGKVRSTAELGRWIARHRQDQDLTQSALAGWVAVDRTTIVRLEAGRVAQVDRLFDVLSVLGLDLVIVPRAARVEVADALDRSSP